MKNNEVTKAGSADDSPGSKAQTASEERGRGRGPSGGAVQSSKHWLRKRRQGDFPGACG